MVSGDNFSDGVFKTHGPVLTDVTNRPGKRSFSSISSDSPHKSGDGDSQLAKQVCLGVENSVKKKCQLQFGADSRDKDKFLLQPKGKQKSSVIREERNLLGGVGVSTSTGSRRLTENSFGFGEKGQGTPLNEGFTNHVCENDEGDDKFASSKCGAMELPTISASQDSKFLGLVRCAGLKGDGGANSVVGGEDLLKECSCSFCSKAAYIWSDLHYQDVKGRLSALKKSQKEASVMVQKFSGVKDTVTHDQQNSTESSKLESSLMDQWKSLFVHMENTFAQESNQLESSFETLKDLRENCKNDLELTDNCHFDNH